MSLPTNVLINGKWYLLLSLELAEFLVNNTTYTVFFISYDRAKLQMSKENFERYKNIVKRTFDEQKDGPLFVLELELPELQICFNTKSGNSRIDSRYGTGSFLYHKIIKAN